MAVTFDPNAPHGVIFGDPYGRMYEQGGVFFNGSGELWLPTEGLDESVVAAEPAAKPKKPAKPAAPAADGVDAELAAQLKG